MNPRNRRIRFEHHPSRVMFDPLSMQFVVTWSKCVASADDRLKSIRDPMSWMPSVSAMASLFDRGCIPMDQMRYAAEAVGRAWDSGDRVCLDTEGAKKAAEMVRDLASMGAGDSDIGQAMCRLVDETAKVRFSETPASEFSPEAMVPMRKAIRECFSIAMFPSWPPSSQRKRFLYCLNRRERTRVAYALASVMFGTGACPILPVSDRRILRTVAARRACENSGRWAVEMTEGFAVDFLTHALAEMARAKAAGRDSIGAAATQQELADSVSLPLKQGETACSS